MTVIANAAIPTAIVFTPAMVVLLAPIVLIEAMVLRRCVKPTPAHPRRLSLIANCVSTFVGIPFVYFGIWTLPSLASDLPKTFAEASVLERIFWLLLEGMMFGPDDPSVPSKFLEGAVLLHLVFFACSALSERAVVRWLLWGTGSRGVGAGVLIGNALTYVLLPVGYVAVMLALMAVVK